MLSSHAAGTGGVARGCPTNGSALWPLAPAPATPEPYNRYGVYSLFPGAGSPAPGIGVGQALYHTSHKVTDALFSSSNYTSTTFGAPTPPPGSPYSPVPVSQLELLAKGINTNIASAVINTSSASNVSNSSPVTKPPPTKRCCWLKLCGCHSKSSTKTRSGCSRTNPVDWQGVQIKREATTPCQVAEVTTSEVPGRTGCAKVKVEACTEETQCHEEVRHTTVSLAVTNNSNIPVGIAVARQRLQQDFTTTSSLTTCGPSLLTSSMSTQHVKEPSKPCNNDGAVGAVSAVTAVSASGGGPTVGLSGGGATDGILHCSEDRTPGLATWPMGSHATPTMWQYPAPMPLEPLLPMPIPMPPMGYQLVRDPSTGHLLLIPTASLEPLSQAVVWPSYPQPSSHVLLPPMPPPPPLAPLQLLSSTSASSDYLTTSTTLQHTQTHSTRLVAVTGSTSSTTDKTRSSCKGLSVPAVSLPVPLPTLPLPLPAHTLIKIEADCTATATALDSTVSPQSHAPFVLYQHPNLILQPPSTVDPTQPTAPSSDCKSQATSPVTCLTPPPENICSSVATSAVQDASNQTDHPVHVEVHQTVSSAAKNAKTEKKSEIKSCDEDSLNAAEAVEEKIIDVKLENAPNSKPCPDISGLQLLSNSIEEFESITRHSSPIKYESAKHRPENGDDVLSGIAHMTLKDHEAENAISSTNVDESLGGLGLLCALAEQRIMEEGEQRREKRKLFHQESREFKPKRNKHSHDYDFNENDRQLEKERMSILKKVTGERGLVSNEFETNNNCNCRENNNKVSGIKSPNKFPHTMSSAEQDMRLELADLQRRCKEKKLELSKLNTNNKKLALSPSRLEKLDSEKSVSTFALKSTQDLLKPPTLCPVIPMQDSYKRSYDSSDSTSPEKVSSSKKRKVGRPKKLMAAAGLRIATTETIVAKKPRAKAGLVSYILAAKNRLQMQHKNELTQRESTPPRYTEDMISSPKGTPVKTKSLKNLKNARDLSYSDKKSNKRSKIRPKLKAEPTIKTQLEIDSLSDTSETDEPLLAPSLPITQIPQPILLHKPDSSPIKKRSVTIAKDEDIVEPPEEPEPALEETTTNENDKCVLTAQHLSIDKLRVLTAMGGLFYAGQLTAVRAPDVYAITLDGERGNRPHIMSREEILRDAIVEVPPANTAELLPGTRLCAYWSQQYRCLYPGTVAEPGTPDPQLDLKFVCVEFDDGDSGRIALEDIRLLPTDFPIIEYDPNPLLSLSKRRRRTSINSVTEERRSNHQKSAAICSTPAISMPELLKPSPQAEKENTDINRQIDQETHRERKKLKKRKKEKLKKLLNHEDKKKKRKHRCYDEKCKHRKHHKKHRKHKKHHHSRSETEDTPEVVEPLPLTVEPEKEDIVVIEEEEDDESVVPQKVQTKAKKSKKKKERRESVESRSKMAAFLPARQLWSWSGRGYKRVGVKGRAKKQFFKAIQRGKESIMVGDCAVFLSTGRPDRPYIGKIEAMWESWGTNMVVRVKWFYHPEETIGCPLNLKYPGALFESPHVDENDVQTISHKCEVLPLKAYTTKLGPEPERYETIYDNNDIYYLAGYYDPTTTTLTIEPDIPFSGAELK